VCGIPDVFYTDHGSDFTSRHIEQVAADLKMRLVFSLPGQPRGRGKIERLFNTINQMCLAELPGYAPRGTPDRAKQAALTLPELDTAIGRSSATATTTGSMARRARRRRRAGTHAASFPGFPTRSSSSTCCC
jgi:transposase InsO family protein